MFTNKHNIFVLSFSIIAIFIVGAFAAFAQDDTATPTPSNGGCGMMGGYGMGMMNGHGMGNWNSSEHPMFVAFADTLGLSSDELLAELEAGKTIAEIATEQGVEIQAVYDAAIVAHETHLAAQVEAGTITQEQADACQSWMQENSSNHPMFNGTGMTGGCPMGHGNGMGAHGRMGGHGMGRWGN